MTFLTALFLGIILISVFAVAQIVVSFFRVAILVAYGKDLAKKYQAAKAQQTVDAINQAFGRLGASVKREVGNGLRQQSR